MEARPIRWVSVANAVEVVVPQRTGLRTREARLRAMGTTLQVDAEQLTDRSAMPVPTRRVRRLGLVGLTVDREQEHDANALPTGFTLVLRRPDRPDVRVPGLQVEATDLDALCAALAAMADRAAGLQGAGITEVPAALRAFLADLDEG